MFNMLRQPDMLRCLARTGRPVNQAYQSSVADPAERRQRLLSGPMLMRRVIV